MEKKKRGRPSTYVRKVADEICQRMSDGETLKQICRSKGMPSESTVRTWSRNDVDGFYARYVQAREALVDCWASEITDIADDGTNDWEEREGRNGNTYIALNKEAVERSKLRVETRKWLLSKLRPDIYGERVRNEISGSLAVTDAIDRPPRETRDEWINRRQRELGAGAAMGAAAGSSNGRHSG